MLHGRPRRDTGCLVLSGSLLKGILLLRLADQIVLLFPPRIFVGDHLGFRTLGRTVLTVKEAILHSFMLLRDSIFAEETLPRDRRSDQDEFLPRSASSGNAALFGEAKEVRRRSCVENGACDEYCANATGVRRASTLRINDQEGCHSVQALFGQSREQTGQRADSPKGFVSHQ